MFPLILLPPYFRKDSKWKEAKLTVKKKKNPNPNNNTTKPNKKQQEKPPSQKQTTHTYLLTTATGKLKAGRPVSLMVTPSALQEIKLQLLLPILSFDSLLMLQLIIYYSDTAVFLASSLVTH